MLQVARGLRIRIAKNSLLGSLSSSSGEFFIAPEVLALLQLIHEEKSPKNLAKSLKQFLANTSKNLPEQDEIVELLNDLQAAGLIVNPSETKLESHLQADGFGDPWVQWTMIADRKRTKTYFDAITALVEKNDVVLDVGAGSGILGIYAVLKGAQKVLAIEETNAAQFAQKLAKSLDLKAPQFQISRTNSYDALLPNDTTLIISELFGNDPFQEGVLRTLSDIASRMSHLDIKFIPESLECFVELIDLLDCPQFNRIKLMQQISESTLKSEELSYEECLLSKAFSALQLEEISFPYSLGKNDYIRASHCQSLGEVKLNPPAPRVNYCGKTQLQAKIDVKTPAVLFWFRAHLIKNKFSLSSSRSEEDFAEHWSPILIPLKQRHFKKDEKIEIDFGLNDEQNFLHIDVSKSGRLLGKR